MQEEQVKNKQRHLEHQTEARQSRFWIASLLMLLAMTMLYFSAPALAEEKSDLDKILEEQAVEEIEEDPSVKYSPDFCDFEITFPDKPFTTKRCPEGVGKCYNLTGYTMVYNLSTTVEVSVTCVPSPPKSFGRYNDRVIRTALNGMVERAGVSDYSINVKEFEDMRQGSLVGTGKYGKQSRIYNAQLWIGKNSVFTVEAKLSGRSNREADASFGDILDSIRKVEK